MKKWNSLTRFVAIVLALALTINLLPADAIASSSIGTATANDSVVAPDNQTVSEDTDTSAPYIMAEVTEERTETTKTFRMSDGSYTMAIYDQPVHYEKADGSYEEIDNTIVEEPITSVYDLNHGTGSYGQVNRAGNTAYRFQEKQGISMEVDGQTISWAYVGATAGEIEWEEASGEKNLKGDDRFLTVSGAITKGVHTNAFPYTDLEYQMSPEGMKENIILKDRKAGNTWTLQADIGTFTAVQTNEKTVELLDEKGEIKLVIAAPEMIDAVGKMSTDISLSMTCTDGEMTLTITADEDFLESADTVYPVTVDPYFFLVAGSVIDISDTYLSANRPSTSMRSEGYAIGSIIVGNESSVYGKTRGLLKLDELPNLPAGSVITDAQLILKNYYSYSGGSMTVEVRRATGNWTEGGATWNNSSNLYENLIQDYRIVPKNTSPSNLFDTWEITRLVKGWYEGTYANYGVMLTAIAAETASPKSCTKYYSSNCPSYAGLYPTFSITFRSNIGLEDYWTYHTQSVNGGTGYVNDYSGNLVYSIPVAETTGLNMPIGINFVYNSQLSNQHYRNNTKGSINGAGWMTSYGQRLDLVSNMPEYSNIAAELIAEKYDYVWLDSDGTHHFFQKQSDGTYKDEDGLGLTIKLNQIYGSYTVNVIEDKNGNKTGFLTNGYLLYMENHLGQRITMGYNGANLSWIRDGAGRQITFGYSGNAIINITYPEGTITFNYSGYNLYTINYPDGTKMHLRYTPVTAGGSTYYLLTMVTGRDGVKMSYGYGSGTTAQQACRVTSVTEYTADNICGNSIALDYTKQNTTIITYNKTSGTVKETYQFNNWGHTTDVVGDDGSISNVQYNTTKGSAKKNKVTQVSAGTKYVENLLTNHSAESGTTGWGMSTWSSANATFSANTTNSYLGNQSFQVTQNDAVPTRAGWRQDMVLTVGKTYTFSAYVKTENVVPYYQSGATLYVVHLNGSVETGRTECETQLLGTNDWQRINVTFTVPTNTTKVQLYGGLRYANGTAWFDCFQLEQNETVSPYNLVENGSITRNGNWTGINTTTSDALVNGQLKVTGEPTKKKGFYQVVNVNRSGVAFQMRGKGQTTPNPYEGKSDSCFGIDMGIHYADGTSEYFCTRINPDVTDWQSASLMAVPATKNQNKVISSLYVYVLHYQQANTAYFDDIMVTIDETGTTYTYDEKGNLKSSADNAKRQTIYDIDDATNMIQGITDSTNTVYTYGYDTTYKKLIKSAKENSTGMGFEYTYGTGNNKGNVEKVQMGTVGSMTANKYIETSTTYTDNGAYVKTETDQRGNTTTYEVNSITGEVDYVTDPAGVMTDYTYDDITKNLKNVAVGNASVTYGYDTAALGNRLKSITSNGQTYEFIYDQWGNTENVIIGNNIILTTNQYAQANGNLTKSIYGNGHSVEYLYDKYDRVTGKKVSAGLDLPGVLTVGYTYNADGQIARVTDYFNAITTNYEYDISGRMIEYFNALGRLSFGYDNQDRTSKVTFSFLNQKFTTNFNYLSANRPGVTNLPIGKVDRTYDSLQRETVHKIYAEDTATSHLRVETAFEDVSGNRTTELVSGYSHYVGTSDTEKTAVAGYTAFDYTYDSRGNITEIEETNGTQTRKKSYVYDALNQLVRENDEAQGKTFVYSYDNGGNVLAKTEYVYTTEEVLGTPLGTKTYQYGDTQWKDKLTSYNGQGITYDAIGNPLSYYNGMTFNWEQGRRLSQTTLTDGTTLQYAYNPDGIRFKKTVGTVETTYFTDDGGTIYAMTVGNESLVFLYDATGRREGFIHYTGETSSGTYYYLYNAQGDVIGITDDTFTPVVTYEYDAWGKLLTVSGSEAETIGSLNPFRYRGYVYDEETGFYYVSSRYYDPEIGRFLNADDIDYLGADGSPLSYNLFAYCMNNPVNRFDVNGNCSMPNWLKVTVGAVAIAGLAVATVCTGGAAAVICGAALSGAIAGGASGAVMGAIGGGISGGWQGALDGACSGFMSGTLIGGATGAASAGLNIATGATTVVGNAHGSTLHKLATNMEAGKMAASGQYSQIGINKSLGKMGLNGGLTRPDVIGIGKNGVNKLVEVVSPRQSTTYISTKMSNMISNNSGTVGKIVNWVRRLFK